MPTAFELVRTLCAGALLLVAARSVGRAFEFWRLPRVIGEIVGGVLLGPTCASYLWPNLINELFPTSGQFGAMLSLASQIGLILLMYLSGQHLRSFARQDERKVVAVLAVIGIFVPFVAGLTVVQFIDTGQLIGPGNDETALLLVFGTAIAIASIPVISRIMIDLGIMDTPFARIVVATAVIDDFVLYVVLAIALGLVQSHAGPPVGIVAYLSLDPASAWATTAHVLASVAMIVATLLIAPVFINQALRRRLPLLRWDNATVVQLILLVVVAAASDLLGVNPMFGALAAGMAVGRTIEQHSLGESRSIARTGQFIFIPLYFALVGFKLDLLHHFDVTFFTGFLAFACAVKAASIYVGARIAREPRSTALNLAAALNARGGPGIVLASVALEGQIISENFFAILVLTAIVTSLFAGVWLRYAIQYRTDLRWGRPRVVQSAGCSPVRPALSAQRVTASGRASSPSNGAPAWPSRAGAGSTPSLQD